MLRQEDIAQYGGKAAIVNHVKEKLPDMPIKPYVVKGQNDSIDSVLSDFNAMQKPVIVRSSSPHEYGDFEGIFESVRDVRDIGGLKRAIHKVEESAFSERAEIYAKQGKIPINGSISVMIQEQSDSQYLGAMMRHPNNPDLILMSYHNNAGKWKNHYNRALFNERTRDFNERDRCFPTQGISLDEAKFLFEKYKQIESLTEIASGYSLFIEFGQNPFSLYQVRPFKQIKTARFELPSINDYLFHSDLPFGITPKEGIVLPIIRGVGFTEAIHIARQLGRFEQPDINFSNWDFELKHQLSNIGTVYEMRDINDETFMSNIQTTLKHHNIDMDGMMKKKYCFMTSSAKGDEYDVDLTLPKMKSLIVGRTENFLVHNMIRLVKKADITVTQTVISNDKFYENAKSIDDKVRIISNGREAIVLKE